MKVSIIGLGYVGISSALVMSEAGIKIIGVDNDKDKINDLKNGKIKIYELGLSAILQKSLKEKNIEFTNDLEHAIKKTDISFLCVGTPLTDKNEMDLDFIKKSVKSISQIIKRKQKHILVVKSTILPGTCEKIIIPILEKYCPKKYVLIFNPEFLREGYALYDTKNPDRVIIGTNSKTKSNIFLNINSKITSNKPPILITNYTNAELIKFASNTFLATKISFANSMSDLCEKILNADVGIVMQGMGLDSRITNTFLNAGVGFGGSCLPKDLQALIQFAKKNKQKPKLLQSTWDVNYERVDNILQNAKKTVKTFHEKEIAILGLSFKPNTDDIRDAPSIRIIKSLLKEGAKIRVYDPKAMKNIEKIFHQSIFYAESIDECLQDANMCLILTEWDEFTKLTNTKIKKLMKTPIVLDGRRVLINKNLSGINYFCVGKGKTN